MKTLDEVIKALDICRNPDINRICKDCPMPDSQRCIEVLQTYALHYLKEYKKLSALDNIAFREDADDPLTWDELRAMEGKPVWIEYIRDKLWVFIVETECAEREISPRITALFCAIDRRINLLKEDHGVLWQAYRKEHHDAETSI